MARRARIDLRVYEDEKNRWDDAAERHQLKLSEMIRQAVERYIKFLERLEER